MNPDIYDISWVTHDNFDPEKLEIVKHTSDMYERGKLMYNYAGTNHDLVVTVPRNVESYITCRGVQKDTFGEAKIETNRYGAQLILESKNQSHQDLYNLFAKVQKRVADLTGCNVIFPIKDMETYSIIYTNLIHSNDGRMFSSAYTEDEQIDILNCNKKCIVRPALLLSTIKKSSKEIKIRIQISQMYVHKEIKNFPLAHKD